MKLSFAEKTLFSRSSNCYLQIKKWRYHYYPLHSVNAVILSSVHQIMPKIIQKNNKALPMQEKKHSVIPNSYAYLLTNHCNLIFCWGAQMTTKHCYWKHWYFIVFTKHNCIYVKWIQGSCTLEYLEHYQVYSLFPCQLMLKWHFRTFLSPITNSDSWHDCSW